MAKIYHSIPGLGTGRGSLQIALRTRLYQGPDHLLVVQSTGYTEEYKRIFYRDIRYVEVRLNKGQLWHTIISGGLVLFFLLLYYLNVPAAVAVIFGLPCVVWLLLNLYRGPSCDCYINTSVQTLKIPTPRRTNKVVTLINFLRTQTASFDPAVTGQPLVNP